MLAVLFLSGPTPPQAELRPRRSLLSDGDIPFLIFSILEAGSVPLSSPDGFILVVS